MSHPDFEPQDDNFHYADQKDALVTVDYVPVTKESQESSNESNKVPCECMYHAAWPWIYLIGFLAFSLLTCIMYFAGARSWRQGLDNMREMAPDTRTTYLILISMGCVCCLSWIIYLFVHFKDVSERFEGEENISYIPILHSFFMAAVTYIVPYMLYAIYIVKPFTQWLDEEKDWSPTAVMIVTFALSGAFPEEPIKYASFVLGYKWFGIKPTSNRKIRLMVLMAAAAGMGYGVWEAFQYVTSSASPGLNQYDPFMSKDDMPQLKYWLVVIITLQRMLAIPFHIFLGYIQGCCYVMLSLEETKYNCFEMFIYSTWMSYLIHLLHNYEILLVMKLGGVAGIFQIPFAVFEFGSIYWLCKYKFRQLKNMFNSQQLDGKDQLEDVPYHPFLCCGDLCVNACCESCSCCHSPEQAERHINQREARREERKEARRQRRNR